MKFDQKEKMAVIKMTYEVILADGTIHPAEIIALEKLKFEIGFNNDFMAAAQNMDIDEALVPLHNMSYVKKKVLAQILEDMAISDNFLHEKEMSLIIQTFKNIGIGGELE